MIVATLLAVRNAATRKPRVAEVRAAEQSAVRRLTHTAQSLRDEQRHRAGQRRTTAEPLTASWQPEVEDVPERRRKRGLSDRTLEEIEEQVAVEERERLRGRSS